MLLALLWKSSQDDVFISRESRTLLMLTNLNRQKDFTPYQSPPFLCWIFFLQVSVLTPDWASFWVLQPCGVRWEGLLSVPHLRTFHPAGRVVCMCFVSRLSALLFHCELTWLLTAWIKNIHSTKVSWALAEECIGLIVPGLGELCDTGKYQKRIFWMRYCEIAFASL